MQIENNPAYTLLQPARGAQNQGLFDINRADPARSGAAVSSATEARPVNKETALVAAGRPAQTGAISGTIRNLLSPRTTQLAIDQQIKEGAQADVPEETQNAYFARQKYYDRLAADSVYAAEEAKIASRYYDSQEWPLAMLSNDVDFYDPGGGDIMIQVLKQRTALYEEKVAQGVPPAQIHMDLLEFNLNLPDSYTEDVLDPFDLRPPGYYKSLQQNALNMLRDAMARAEAANSQETAV